MNSAIDKLKYILTAGIAVFMINQLSDAIGNFKADTNIRMNFGAGLMIGMQLIMIIAMLVLCAIAAQNLFQLFVEVKFKDDIEMNENAQKLLRFTKVFKVFASLALRLVFSLLFIELACIALFAPGVKSRDDGVYGAAIFMLVVAGFMAVSNIRVAIKKVRSMKEESDEAENV